MAFIWIDYNKRAIKTILHTKCRNQPKTFKWRKKNMSITKL